MGKRVAVDIDGVITNEITGRDYENRTPNFKNIGHVNQLFDAGHYIILFSARYVEDLIVTKKWLTKYGVKYHEIILGKLQYDYLIDDRAYNTFMEAGIL